MKPKTGYSAGKSRAASKKTSQGIAKAKKPGATNQEIQERAAKLISKKPKRP